MSRSSSFLSKIKPIKRDFWVATCVDPRLRSEDLESISNKIFNKPFNPLLYSHRTAGTENKSSDKSTKNLINAMAKTSELQSGENFLLMVHNDCLAVKSGVVEPTKKSGTYFDHLQEQVEEMLKNDNFKDMVKNGKLDFAAALYSHNSDKTKPDNVEAFKVKLDDEGKATLKLTKKFPVEKSDSKSKTEGQSR